MRREFKQKSSVLLIDDNYEHVNGIKELLNLEGRFNVGFDGQESAKDCPDASAAACPNPNDNRLEISSCGKALAICPKVLAP